MTADVVKALAAAAVAVSAFGAFWLVALGAYTEWLRQNGARR